MRRKASFTTSPLALAQTPIHRLARRIQDYLFFPDPQPLYAVVGALVSAYAFGRPVWLLLIGPPSCGKSELLSALLSIPGIVAGGAITGVGALLSASSRRDRNRQATGGLLRDMGSRGMLVIKEFTSLLSLPNETLRTLLAALREVYDGRWTRQVGTDGGQTLEWIGKCSILSGSTEAIDHHQGLMADMGERFVSYRYGNSEGWTEAYTALNVPNPEILSDLLQHEFAAFAADLGLDWGDPPELPPLDTHDQQRLISFAQFSAHARSAVVRDRFSKEVIQASGSEYPARLSVTLGQLLSAMRYIGVDEGDAWGVIGKVSWDSISGNRRAALRAILTGLDGTGEIADSMQVSQATTRRTLEELKIHHLIERTDQSHWRVTGWTRDRLREASNGIIP